MNLKNVCVFAGVFVSLAVHAQSLPMPQQQALRLAQERCDDVGFAAGQKALAEQCKADNIRGEETLQRLRRDPSIRVEFWTACNSAVGFQSSLDYGSWAKCVEFVAHRCPTSAVSDDASYKRCLRAIQSDGWLADPAAR